jgi:hypothetical protein
MGETHLESERDRPYLTDSDTAHDLGMLLLYNKEKILEPHLSIWDPCQLIVEGQKIMGMPYNDLVEWLITSGEQLEAPPYRGVAILSRKYGFYISSDAAYGNTYVHHVKVFGTDFPEEWFPIE